MNGVRSVKEIAIWLKQGAKPDSATYASLLRQCSQCKALQEGKLLHSHIVEHGYDQETLLANLLIQMYGNCGSLEDARAVFDKLHLQQNVFSWNIMIAVYSQSGHLQDARRLFDTMPIRNVVSWNTIIASYVQNGHLDEARSIFEEAGQRDVVSWNTIVAAYALSGHLCDAQSTFDRMPRRAVASWNALLQGYAQSGDLQASLILFNEMPQSDLFSWTAMIQAYARTGHLQGARNVLDRMPQRNVVCWTAMLQAYAQNAHVHDAKKIFDKMPDQDVITWTTMLVAYAQNGLLQDAKSTFEQMTQRNAISWNAMVAAYGQNGHLHEALSMFENMPQQNTTSCNSVIQALAHGGNMKSAENLFNKMPKRDVISWNITVEAYAQNGHVEDARSLFNRMPQRSVVSWTTMVSAYAQNGQLEDARNMFEGMEQRNFVSWNAIIQAYAENAQLEKARSLFDRMPLHDVVSWTAMVTTYVQSGYQEDARDMFNRMPGRDVASWNAMIAALAQNGPVKDALELFRFMDMEGVQPDVVTYVSALDACASLAAISQGRIIHSNILSSELHSDTMLGTAIVNMYRKCGRIEEARSVFDAMHKRDVVSWNAMMAAYAQSGHGKHVLELLPAMELEGLKLDNVTCISVISAYSHAGLVEDGRRFFGSISEDYGLIPNVDHYVCMIDLLGRAGRLREAEELVNFMPFEADTLAWMTLLSACRSHGNVERAERTAELVFKLAPENLAPYVLLSNIHAAARNWNAAANVRKAMEERGVKKIPGCSMIEIKDQVHEFTVGDKSHPRKKEIYAELLRLSELMKEAGYVPETKAILHDVDEEEKEHMLGYHSEKLAIALGLISTRPEVPLFLVKNLRVCVDCHTATKFISKISKRSITVRDANRFHHFEHGVCSCGDYW